MAPTSKGYKSEGWHHCPKYSCPNCRSDTIWTHKKGKYDDNLGDEAGVTYICITCESYFYLPVGVVAIESTKDKNRLKHIRQNLMS